jgi:hypothetical protein
MKKRPHRDSTAAFSAIIHKIGINPVVDPPADVLQAVFEQAGKSKGPIPVRGRINRSEFIQTLVKYRGAWRLYINGPMLKASGLSLGDTAIIEIEFDPKPREVPMPKAFATVLRNDNAALAEYEKLTPSRKKEILKYLGFLKNADSLARNVEQIMRHLSGEKTDKPHVVMRKKKGG